MNIDKLRYPIGKFVKPDVISQDKINEWIHEIELFPSRLTELVKNISDDQLEWQYRPDGWSVRQVVHHCADSHMNALTRFKWTLTEDIPRIKPYFEDRWAELADTAETPISASLKILEGLHQRWVVLLKSLSNVDFKKEFIHPEHGKKINLAETVGIYAWHCNHHTAHIKQAIEGGGD